MASIKKLCYQGNKVRWKARVHLSGFPARSKTFDKRADAVHWAADMEQSMRLGKLDAVEAATMHTGHEMIERYLRDVMPYKSTKASTIARQTAQCRWWLSKIGDYRLVNITHFVIADCRDSLQQRGLKAATVNHYLAALSHVFAVAKKDWGWVQANPVQEVTKLSYPPNRVRYLASDELRRLLHACKQEKAKPLHDIVMLALCTGARKSELLGIKLEDIDLSRERITIHHTKNHESRTLHLSEESLGLVATLLSAAKRNQVYLFEYRLRHVPVTIDVEWRRARARARIKDFRFHDLRHTFASYMAMDGASIMDISEVLGHKKLEMVKRYAHLCDSHASNVVASMTKKFLFSHKGASQDAAHSP